MEDYQEHSLSSRVFQKIRDNILDGTYREHDELRENTIGKELGVSRTPVREALRQLELEGLVTIIPNKGAYVTGITTKDVHDIYTVRSMLEGLCARWATEHISQEQLDELEEIMLLSEFHMKRESGNNTDQIAILDGRFHAVLYDACDSRILSHVLKDFHKYVQTARKNFDRVGRTCEKVDPGAQADFAVNPGPGCRSRGTACKRTYPSCDAEPKKAGI